MKKILSLFLAAVMLFATAGCEGSTATPAATPTAEASAAPQTVSNPVNTVAGFNDLLTAQSDIKLNDAPAGSTEVTYAWIANIPAIAQVSFSYQGCDYTYRAAASSSEASALDISGVYDKFPTINSINLSNPNGIGGSYVLKYDSTLGAGLASWYLPLTQCQYTLYTPNGCSGSMPMMALMEQLYSCVTDVKNAKGTVLEIGSNSIIISFENSNTSVLELGQVTLKDIAIGDSVELSYIGELDGISNLISIKKLGTAATKELIGTVNTFGADWVYVISSDNNIFELIINNSTVITGLSSVLSNGCSVRVEYEGELYGETTAKTIEITEIKPVATPTPTSVPKAATYVTRNLSGYVTSAAGIYVTVSGILFTINGAECYVSGSCYEGAYANITYKDYGGGYYVVTEAYFSDPQPAPEPYVSKSCCGYVTDAYGNVIVVNGMSFSVSNLSESFVMDGTPDVGAYAEIYYNDYGNGYYEITYAYFNSADYTDEYDLTDEEIEEFLNSEEFAEFVEYLG